MRTFSLLIHDTRYDVPTVELATAPDQGEVGELAKSRLAESPFHMGVQVRDEDQLLFWFHRMQSPTLHASL